MLKVVLRCFAQMKQDVILNLNKYVLKKVIKESEKSS